MRRLKSLGVLIGAAGLLTAAAACGSSGPSSGSGASTSSGPSGTLTIANEFGSTWTCQFNPFNPNVSILPFGPVYEPLVFMDNLESGKTSPWLATSWTWSDNNKVLTFNIRQGVKWSDGVPFTAKDVVFTFDELKKFPGLDIQSDWSFLSSVVQKGSDQVVMTFKTAGTANFYYAADQTPIIPEHIWASIKNPVTYNDNHPVGTGAYTVSACTPENITYSANKHYYISGEPKVATVDYPAFLSNNTANQELADGQAQWGNQFIPSIQSFYSGKSASNKYWFPPTVNNEIFINLKKPLLDELPVRQAMAYAIDRQKVSQIGEYGYEPPANQTGIVTPTFSSWEDTAEAAKYNYDYDPAKAKSILTAAGFKMGSNGIFETSSGTPLQFTIVNIGDYSDWVASVQIIQQEFKAVGIGLTVDNLSSNAYDAAMFDGNYELGYNTESGGPGPYYELRQWLLSANSAPIGQTASTNWERYENPATDALLDEYSAASPAQQHQIIDQLQEVMLSQVPLIPVTESVDWYEYNTADFTGWPTASDPYDQPGPALTPDFGWTLLHLAPAKG
jgi:peptide/nickel transport system substrate-binding protein